MSFRNHKRGRRTEKEREVKIVEIISKSSNTTPLPLWKRMETNDMTTR
jgi:hypothetical protein